MKIVLLRHAARMPHDTDDPTLTEYGHWQTQQLSLLLRPQGPLPVPTELLASPRTRARDTLKALGEKLSLEVEIEAKLDERAASESSRGFATRVSHFLEHLKTRDSNSDQAVIWICSHMDWLEAALNCLCPTLPPSDAGGWPNCQARVFRLDLTGEWELVGKARVEPKSARPQREDGGA